MRFIVLVVVGFAGFLLLAQPLIHNQLVVTSDLGRAHLPSRDFYQRCLQSGNDFSWCPGQFCGYFIHGEGQGGYEHPLHRALYSWLPLTLAFNLEVFLSYPFLLVGMYLFLRRHELPRDAALFGGLSFAFSGFALSHYPHTNAIAIVAHMPWLLWAIDILWRSESRPARAWAQFAITLLTASQILLGYPQYLWFSAMAEGLYVLTLLHAERRWDRLAMFVVAKVLGILAGCAQLLPSLEALRESPRMGYSDEFRGTFSLQPAQLLQLFAPSLFNERTQLHEYAVYAGTFASLALVWLFIRPKTPSSILGRWALIVTVCAVPLALGKYTPLFKLYLKLPVIGVFRGPCRYMVLVHLAAATLVALATAQIANKQVSRKRLALLLIVPMVAWLLTWHSHGHAAWLGHEMQPFTETISNQPGWFVARGAIVLTIATGLFAFAACGSRAALTLLMLLTLADQLDFGYRSIRLYPTADLPTLLKNEEAPPGPVTGRVELGDVFGNTLMMREMKLTSGYVGLTPPRKLDYTKLETQRLAGTTWWHDGKNWTAGEGAQPRVRLVSQVKKSDDAATDLGTIDPSKVVLLNRDIEVGGMPGTASVMEDRPGHIVVWTQCDTKQMLVLNESFHPAWHATIGGQPAVILRAYGDFQACVVPAGARRVEFDFEPISVVWGRRLSWLGLLCSAGLTLCLSIATLRRSSEA